jgi:hypothetical protein
VSVYVFILVRGTEHYIVLEGVETMVEQKKLDRDLRRQLEEREAEVAFLKTKSFHCSTEADTGSGLPIYTELGGPDTGATLRSRP